jgi:hypothetical protein
MVRLVLLMSTCCLLITLAACGGSTGVPPAPAAQTAGSLPELAALDGLRGVSSSQQPLDVTTPLTTTGTTVIGGNLGFTPAPGSLAWAVFRIRPPVETVVSIAAGGDDGLYLLLADYGRGTWSEATELATGFAVAPLNTLTDPLSPEGYVYCAVLAPGGTTGQLESLALNYDGPAHVYYVAPPADGGDDTNPGTYDEPWVTLQQAANTVTPDSLVIVRAGVFDPFVLSQSGTDGAPIIFKGLPGATIAADGQPYGVEVSQASWVTIEGLLVQNATGVGIRGGGGAEKSQYLTVRNNYVSNCDDGAVSLYFTDYALVEGNWCDSAPGGVGIAIGTDSDHAVVRNNNITGCNFSGIQFENDPGGDNSLDDELITGNTVYGNGISGFGYGIGLDGVSGSTISNNQLYSHPDGLGLVAFNPTPCTNNLIINNTIVQLGDQLECVLLSSGCTGNRLYNNVLFCANANLTALDLQSDCFTGFDCDYNIMSDGVRVDGTSITFDDWQNGYFYDINGHQSTPDLTFLDAVLPDLHLLPAASAVDAGSADYAPAVDLDGVVRPQGSAPDCGCFELVP